MMKPKLELLSTITGILGTALCLLAIVLRLLGDGAPDFMRVRAINVFIVGMGVMVFACWAKLQAR